MIIWLLPIGAVALQGGINRLLQSVKTDAARSEIMKQCNVANNTLHCPDPIKRIYLLSVLPDFWIFSFYWKMAARMAQLFLAEVQE